MKALVVEDAPEVIETIVLCLTIRWPAIGLVATDSGADAIHLTRAIAPDIVLLDLGLADIYGLQVLKEIRSFSAAPVIIITGNNDETSRLKSFDMGTDDYLLKPFTHIELLGSMTAAVGLPHQPARGDEDDAGAGRGLVVNIAGRRVLCDGADVALTPTEWKILVALIHDHGIMIPYAKIGKVGWETGKVTRSTARACVRQLGAKLGDAPDSPGFIQYWGDEGCSLALFP